MNSARAADPDGSPLSDRDRQLLAFIAEQRFVLPAHAWALAGASGRRRLSALSAAGLVARDVRLGSPSPYFATRDGLDAVGRRYRVRPIKYGTYRHDVGVAWLWLAARAGTFGPLHEVISERALRSHDASSRRTGPPLGVRLGGHGASGRDRLHYPDLLLVTPDGKRVAFELELTSKERSRRETILTGYAIDARIDAVVYLVQSRSVGRAIQASARRLGISQLVHVQTVSGLAGGPGRGMTAARTPQRTGELVR